MDALSANPTAQQANQSVLVQALGDRLAETERSVAELRALVSVKNAQITRLETENLRLKVDRTDTALRTEVAGLRKDVGAKDRRLVELDRAIEKLKESEAFALRRAVVADQKISTLGQTMSTMQTARDAAQTRCALSEQQTRTAEERALESTRSWNQEKMERKEIVSQLDVLVAAADAALRVLSTDVKKSKAVAALEVLVHAAKKKKEEGA